MSVTDESKAAALRGTRGWLIDLDGVINRGDALVEQADEFIALLRQTETPFLFLTNNSTRTPEQYVRRLCGMGVFTELREVYTSALATAEYLRRRAEPGARIAMIGRDGLRLALGEAGFQVVDDPDQAQYCVVGYDPQLTYADLVRAHAALRAGATFIGTNFDPTLPVEGGRLVPGNGATLAALTTASGVQPTLIGKPERIIFDLALARLGIRAGACAVLGDRLDTDIAGGKGAGTLGVLILTGSTSAEQVAGAVPQPDLVVRDHAELMALWRAR